MNQKVIAVFDIGKTNKKILLFDEDFNLAYQNEEKFPTTVDEDGFECDDIQLIQQWMVECLSQIIGEGKYSIQGVNFSTYGASLAFLDKEGQLLSPIYNYLKEVDPAIQESLFSQYGGVDEFCRKTGSPALGLLLNSGIQAYWLKFSKPHIWENTQSILHFPQYLSYVLSGNITSEPTSIGCHTFMWDFDNKQYHPWLQDKGISLPEPVNNDTVFDTEIAGQMIKVGIGIHDSSASLVPYLQKAVKPFILVSTGTWCINMNPFNDEPLTKEQLLNDCLCFMTPEQKQVKSSRLFMGHFHEKWVEKLNAHFNVDKNLFRTFPYNESLIFKLQAERKSGYVFFPFGINNFEEGLKSADLSCFASFEEAYTTLVMELTRLCINSIKLIIPKNDNSKAIYISGGFARNETFIELLSAAFPDKEVLTSEVDNASALGAALAIAKNISGFSTCNIELKKSIKI